MSKTKIPAATLPPLARTALRQFGEHLAIARTRRKESQHAWAQRIGVSPPTLIRMEKGDPSVSMAVYASALWLMGRAHALARHWGTGAGHSQGAGAWRNKASAVRITTAP